MLYLVFLKHNSILFVDPWSAPENDLDIVRQFNGADAIELLEGYSGQGVRGQVQDGGLLATHADFLATPPHSS